MFGVNKKITIGDFMKINEIITNLEKTKEQLEKLNGITFSNEEWKNFFNSEIANKNHGIEEKTETIQEDYIK